MDILVSSVEVSEEQDGLNLRCVNAEDGEANLLLTWPVVLDLRDQLLGMTVPGDARAALLREEAEA